MTEKNYIRLKEYFVRNNSLRKALEFFYKFLPLFVTVSYMLVALLIIMNYKKLPEGYIIKTIFIPAAVFCVVTLFRKIFDFKRPYEKYNTSPVIPKDKKGHSFPSRHVASGFIIAMSFLYINIVLGISFLIISFIIAFTRILAGVHFIRDVVAGGLFSVSVGFIFMFLM